MADEQDTEQGAEQGAGTTGTEQGADTTGHTAGEQAADETLGESGLKALKAEREARRQAEKSLAETRRRLAEIEAAQLRNHDARAKGRPYAQAQRLTGATREELEPES